MSRPIQDIVAELAVVAETDGVWERGHAFTYVFDGPDTQDLSDAAYHHFAGANGLDPTAFPSFIRFENDLVGFARGLLDGKPDMVGNVSSGGTESIILACKAARDRARAEGLEGRGVLVLPITAHAAFHKAAAVLDLEVRPTAVDDDFRAIPEAIAEAIDHRTVAVVASAPSYAHGVVDPVEAIAEVARSRNVWLHVDACVGGFVLPFIDGSPRFGFSIPGVRSISADIHKYGYAPKGASLVCYADATDRAFQYFATADWTGYPVANPVLSSTRSGGPVAAAWAVVEHLGTDGYRAATASAWAATRTIVDGVRATADSSVRIVAEPDAPLLAITSSNVFRHAERMRDRGWMMTVTPSFGPSPAHLHLTLTAAHEELADRLLTDLVTTASGDDTPVEPIPLPPGTDAGTLRALLGQIDITRERTIVDATIDALDPATRATLISAYVQSLFT
jgi:glutamate/tyrosine decarboxylase-like PLP-dependent enzyme